MLFLEHFENCTIYFLTKQNSSSILEASIVFYFITIQSCSQSSCLRGLKLSKPKKITKKVHFRCVTPGHGYLNKKWICFTFTNNPAYRRQRISQMMEIESLILNIAGIGKRCPENITLVVKCVKFLFLKVLRKRKEKNSFFFNCTTFFTIITTVSAVTTVFFLKLSQYFWKE